MNEDRCVCCGEYVPEGGMVCRSCITKSGAFDQIKWERDIAISQLNDYGISLGEKAELKKVIHAKWISFVGFLHSICSHCGYVVKNKTMYCPDCGATMDRVSMIITRHKENSMKGFVKPTSKVVLDSDNQCQSSQRFA